MCNNFERMVMTVDRKKEIESKLIEFYLKKTGHYGNSVMTSIDVTEETLRIALEGISNPIKTFEYLISVEEKRTFLSYLSGNFKIWGNTSKFRYIVYLCYIASKNGTDSENFQKKLQENLKLTGSSLIQVNGINALFNELEILSKSNNQYREVKLPKNISASMKHIGIIYEFSFPNWRLNNLLTKILSGDNETPESLSRLLTIHVDSLKSHDGLYQAASLFIQRVKLRNKFLEEDPFWNFYLKWKRPQSKHKNKVFFNLENDLEDSYFDVGNETLKITELNDHNSTYFLLKKEIKSFAKNIFFLQEEFGKYEVVETVNKLEKVDAILFDKYEYPFLIGGGKNSLETKKYCFTEVDFNNIEIIRNNLFKNALDDFFPPLQILSSYTRKNLLSLKIAPIQFRSNFDGTIEFIYTNLESFAKKVSIGDTIELPYLKEGDLKIILTTNGKHCLSKVEKFKVINNLKSPVLDINKKEKNNYVMPFLLDNFFLENIKFKYRTYVNPIKDSMEELVELFYFNLKSGLFESDLLKLIKGNSILSHLNPYNVILYLKHYGYIEWGYHCEYKSIKYWPKPLTLKKITEDSYLIHGYLCENTQAILCNTLDLLNINYSIRRIDMGVQTLPMKVLISDVDLQKIDTKYFTIKENPAEDQCSQVGYLINGEAYYRSFDIYKYDSVRHRFLYLREYVGDDGIYLLKQKDKRKCNVYEIIKNKKIILSTYYREQIFEKAYEYGMCEISGNRKDDYFSVVNGVSFNLVWEFFSRNGILPVLDIESGEYYYHKDFLKTIKTIDNMQENTKTVGYNFNRHRKNIRFRV